MCRRPTARTRTSAPRSASPSSAASRATTGAKACSPRRSTSSATPWPTVAGTSVPSTSANASCSRCTRGPSARPSAEAGLESVMCAYSDVNGEPAAASRRLLTDMLRGALGFRGLTGRRLRRRQRALATRQQTASRRRRRRRPGASGRARRRAPGLALLRRRRRAGASATGCSTRPSSTKACGACSMRSSGSGCSRTRTATWKRSPRRTPTTARRSAWRWLAGSPHARRFCWPTRRASCRCGATWHASR